MGERIIAIATRNMHKVEEINSVLRECGYSVAPVDAPKIEVQSNSLKEIAIFAASTAFNIIHRPVIVEDAGLFIDALRGFPGPYSAYVFKTIGISGILKLLNGVVDRRARFISVIALAHENGVEVFEGEARGTISTQPRGEKGFGFDPIFVPEGSDRTFAELDTIEKNKYSHRGKSARKLCEWLYENGHLIA
ncbi:XTP/dITP diphosphatase [Pyrofollis japonicus]|uniref:XTP/dITP diphosphatase n=1 Tax=Pyrofollis japonicus TaxID=3060460 RepID=UPI00295BB97F|nr:XTP/dITP diphosphatase [Pyrofollis japonicus]BEP18630.1 XTP/dITP diphosphatase [Pyrofollis japonicus]